MDVRVHVHFIHSANTGSELGFSEYRVTLQRGGQVFLLSSLISYEWLHPPTPRSSPVSSLSLVESDPTHIVTGALSGCNIGTSAVSRSVCLVYIDGKTTVVSLLGAKKEKIWCISKLPCGTWGINCKSVRCACRAVNRHKLTTFTQKSLQMQHKHKSEAAYILLIRKQSTNKGINNKKYQ